jgi:hypothetical protein
MCAFLIGSGAAYAQWTGLADNFGAHPDTCLLLTDGTVMCHVTSSNRWRKLTPDAFGSYVNGTWSDIANMPDGTDTSVANPSPPPNVSGPCAPCAYGPLYFASVVMPDGRVVVIGGEYNTNGNTWTNIGFLYDPVANAWSAQLNEPFGTGNIGDAQTVILPNGTLLLANISNSNIASFNPATLTFTALNPTGKTDRNDEENWTLLPNGTLLTVSSGIASQFQIYNPATNAWGATGSTPVNIADVGPGTGNSSEVGPAVLRPDGTVVYFSGSQFGQNAVYDTATGTWANTPAMDFPVISGKQFSVPDGPASILPDGHVLVQASPITTTTTFNTPSHFFEFDGTNLTQVADPPGAGNLKSFHGRMLVLPTGEVLFTAYDQNSTDVVQVYSNGGTFSNAWRPVITTAPANVAGGTTYSISGKQFNGLSQGATYGDDAHMATNYPLVRLRNPANGHVWYARTHGHSSMGVATGNAIVSTSFDVPAGIESGPLELFVVANGIPSEPFIVNGPDLTIAKTHSPTLFTQGDTGSGDKFTITVGNTGLSATTGTVMVKDLLPGGLTANAISGSGWTCTVATATCTRADALAAGSSYPAITLSVNVANNAPILVTNTATVSGGGEGSTSNVTGNDTATDNVNIRQHTFTTVAAATEDYHDDVTLQASVAPAGVAGSVTFFIDGVGVGVASYNSATGVATRVYNITQVPGPHTILAAFTSANELYLDSSGTNTLTVKREETTLSYTGDTVIANGGTATMSGVLKEDGIVPIAGRTVAFTLGTGSGAQTCSGVTNAAGIATCAITPVVQPLGPGVVADAFAGDVYYLPSAANATTILFAFLDRGAFNVGDQSAAIGGSVTYWGAQWANINRLSGGAAPNAFKGFANNLTSEPPNCGMTWTSTQGGNSTNPPATVPSYMGVVVPTTVAKSGSTVSGNVLSIVVVKTNADYGPNPGHDGTGIVIAQFCHR